MADNRKYYYLKLKENFFESDSMLLLESMKDGYLYSNILLKLYLKSLKDGGRLILNGRIPYNSQMISSVTRHQVGTVEKALQVFEELGLVEKLDSGVIYMLDIQNFIGESSTEADRRRKYRARIETEKMSGQKSQQMSGQKSQQMSGQITHKITGQMSQQLSQKTPPEIEIEKEIEKEIKYIVEQSPTMCSCKEIIEYLNQRTGKEYKHTSKATQRHINARIAEGFSLEDFKKVIDWKAKEWMGTEMERYLRPETLFGTKFEGYLNSAPAAAPSLPREPPEPEESIDYSQVERNW